MEKTPGQTTENMVAPGHGDVARWWSQTVALGGDGLTRVLKPWENVLEITIGAGDNGVLTLPNCKEAAGEAFLIRLLDDGAGNDKEVTCVLPGSPPVLRVDGSFSTSFTNKLTADDDFWLVRSMGSYWIEIAEDTT